MLITLLAGAFVLSVVILVHEAGHFMVAKWLGIYVKTFSIGFGRKILKKRIGETQYAISILPFGGYVQFAGESGETEEKEGKKKSDPDEIPDSEIDPALHFKNKRGVVKSAVVLAGPLMNYIAAILIYVFVYYAQGMQVIPSTTIGQITPGSPADSVGLRIGDTITAVDGLEVSNWTDLIDEMVEDPDSIRTFTISRDGRDLDVDFKSGREDNLIVLGFYPAIPAKVGRVKRDSPAAHAGMERGAVIEAINDTTITSYYDVERIIHAHPDTALVIAWRMDGVAHRDTVVPEAKKVLKEGSKTETHVVGQIGVGPYYEKKPVAFVSALQMGFMAANGMISEILGFMKMLFTGKAGIDSLGGPILITQMAGDMARWGFNYLLYFLAFFNINLFIFNLLPILPFDGGHLFFFAVEGITRRKTKERLREILTQAGFILLILLMVFVVVMDISRCSGVTPGVL